MKKTQLILAAAALVAFASCSNLEPVNQTKDNEIGFRAVTRVATRANNAIISGTTYGTDNTFNVWGWQSQVGDYSEFSDDDASNFMSNLTIEWTKGRANDRAEAWRNADNYYYWPFTGRISFLAVHPTEVAGSVTAGWDETNVAPKAAIADYTISASNDSTDLMFATAEGARQADALPTVFKHALSQIQFRVRTDADYTLDGVEFKIDSVKINDIDLSGDVTYAGGASTWADNETQTETWSYFKTTQVVNYQASDAAADLYGRAHVMIPQPANVLVIATPAVGTPGEPGYEPATYSDAVQTTLTVGYTMKQGSNAQISGTVTVAAPQLWEVGKKYNYTLNFRLNEILFNPSVTDWVSVDVETINIL